MQDNMIIEFVCPNYIFETLCWHCIARIAHCCPMLIFCLNRKGKDIVQISERDSPSTQKDREAHSVFLFASFESCFSGVYVRFLSAFSGVYVRFPSAFSGVYVRFSERIFWGVYVRFPSAFSGVYVRFKSAFSGVYVRFPGAFSGK